MIRKATIDDAKILRDLRRQLVAENPKVYGIVYTTEKRKSLGSYADWIREYQNKDAAIFLLFEKNKLIGMAAIKRDKPDNPKVGYLGSLGILKEYQQKGFGKLMLEHRLSWAKQKTKFVILKTIITKTNTRMLNLAKKYGFIVKKEGSYFRTPEYYLEKSI